MWKRETILQHKRFTRLPSAVRKDAGASAQGCSSQQLISVYSALTMDCRLHHEAAVYIMPTVERGIVMQHAP